MTIWAELDDWIENVGTREDGNVDLGLLASQTPRPLLAVGTNVTPEPGSENEDGTSSTSPDKLDALDVLCSRYRHVLSLVAYRVLDNHEEAEDAVRNCLLAASANPLRFEHEGAFRSWLVRVLIDEAVMILNKQKADKRDFREPLGSSSENGLVSEPSTDDDNVLRSPRGVG